MARAAVPPPNALRDAAARAALAGAGGASPAPARARHRARRRRADAAQLNRDCRGQDKPTNVLSFPAGRRRRRRRARRVLLGDVVLAFETVAREAAAQDKPLADHLAPSGRARRAAPARLRSRDAGRGGGDGSARDRDPGRAGGAGSLSRHYVTASRTVLAMSDSEPPGSDGQPEHRSARCRGCATCCACCRGRATARACARRIDEMIEEPAPTTPSRSTPQERVLIGNILKVHDHTAADVMVPRVDIVALDVEHAVPRGRQAAWSSRAIRACRSIARRSTT